MTSNARRSNVLGDAFRGREQRSASGQAGRKPSWWQGWRLRIGFGLGFSSVPKPESFINSKALIDARRDTHIPSRDVYANNPNSYINHIRDNGFVERYDVARQRSLLLSLLAPALSVVEPENDPDGDDRAATTPSLPLASFYNAEGQIVWPADAPTAGDLKDKRTAFDQASQAVLAEIEEKRCRVDRHRDRCPPEAARLRAARLAICPDARDRSRRRHIPSVPAVAL